MPEAICDTSVIQYLHQLKVLDLLPGIYGTVVVPRAVAEELAAGRLAGVDVPDALQLPWAQIGDVTMHAALVSEEALGPGESEVLSLALQRKESVALIDDAVARAFARHHQIRFTGTLGIFVRAKSLGLIERVSPLLEALRDRGFRVTPAVTEVILREAGETQETSS